MFRAGYDQIPENYYSLLEVTPNASCDEITRTYRKLALRYHTDRNPNGGEMMKVGFIIFFRIYIKFSFSKYFRQKFKKVHIPPIFFYFNDLHKTNTYLNCDGLGPFKADK